MKSKSFNLLYILWALILMPITGMAQDWICGYPFAKQQPQSITYKPMLQKPAQGERAFWVREDIKATEDITYEQINFTKFDSTSQAVFYVQSSEIDNIGISQLSDFVDQLKDRMFNSTPGGLFNPDSGFYQNEVTLFGEPSDVDGNSKIFILLLDIEDGYTGEDGGSYVAGYFDPLDIEPNSGEKAGNESEILYIDINPGLTQNFEQTITTAAHELQHLLHYGADPGEFTWLNEGMSEVTAHLFGLQARAFSYFLENPNRTLTSFDYASEEVVSDYAKVGLWTLYLYVQYGEEFLRQVVQNSNNGIPSVNQELRQVTGAPTFTEVYHNWVIANAAHNYLPANAQTSQFGYGTFSIPPATPALTLSQYPAIDQNAQIKNLSASYVRIFGGMDLDVQVSTPSNLTLNGTVIMSDGTNYEVVPAYDLSQSDPDFSAYTGYENAWLVLSSPTVKTPEDLSVSGVYAMNIYGSGGQVVENIDYSSGTASFFLTLRNGTAANHFQLPSSQSRIIQAEVNLFSHDRVKIEIRDTLNSETIDSLIIENPTPGWNSWALDSLNLTRGSLSVLVTSDSNGVGLDSTTSYSGNGFYKGANGGDFVPLDHLSTSGENSFTLDGNWNMRLQVAYPGSDGIQEQEPVAVRHNPWIASSEQHGSDVILTLFFDQVGDVRVDVFNILGQHVKNLYNSSVLQANRALQVRWDGTNKYGVRVSSGLYFFAVQKNGEREVKKLSLIW